MNLPMNLLLLRGLIRDQRTWGDFPSRFLAHAPRMNVYCLDMPGVGTENHRPCPTSIPAIRIEIAQRFHTLIAQGKLPAGPWSLMAISMGGMVALDWADAEPDLFKQLIILNTSSVELGGTRERFRVGLVPSILYALATNRPEFSEGLILRNVSNRFGKDPAKRDPKLQSLYENQVKWRKERPVTRTTFLRQLLSATNYRLPIARPKAKTVIISSVGDRLVSSKCSARLAERIGAPHLTHPWAGHDIPIDDPEWLAREVSEWMGAMQ
jgi:pimeloyl-ACP methyl ester carboxylesterase